MELNSKQAADALWEWFRERPELIGYKGKPLTELAAFEAQAVATLLAVVETNDLDVMRASADEVKQLASLLLIDFMTKLMSGHFRARRWTVPDGLRPGEQARHVLGIELRRSHPAHSTRH